MNSEVKCAAAAVIIAVIKPWLWRRNYLGIYNTLVQEFKTED